MRLRRMDKRVRLVLFALLLIGSIFLVHSGTYKSYGLKLLPKELLSATPPTWDSSSSSCQEGRGNINMSLLQIYTNQLKTDIPSPDKFDHTYKSPCWRTDRYSAKASALIGSVSKGQNSSKTLVCLPQVYFMGFPKSGSTQLYSMMTKHPHIKGGLNKEPHWWTRKAFNLPHNVLNISRYISHFLSRYKYIEQNRDTLLVDGSQSTIWDTRKTGNLCYLPQLFAKLFPSAKYIVLMRDPTERLYSDFNYLCSVERSTKGTKGLPIEYQTNGSELFREIITNEMAALEECLKTSSLEHCTHHRIIGGGRARCGQVRLGISLYHVHIKRWLREIPREQFLFLRTDEMAANPYKLLEKVWDFLGVERQSDQDLGDALHRHLYRSHVSSNMSGATEDMLRKFFQPHNDALAELLGDDGFRWS